METRNVTLALPEDLIKKARHRAVDRGLSLSAYVAQILRDQVEEKEVERVAARERMLADMRKRTVAGWPAGKIPWTREEIHLRDFPTGGPPRPWEK